MRQKLSVSEVYSSSDSDTDAESMPPSSLGDIQVNRSFVVVRFRLKNTQKYSIGFVLDQQNNEFTIKFMRKSGISTTGNEFIFPKVDDIRAVKKADILKVLEQPSVNNRQQYLFNPTELYNIENLF